MKLQPFKYLYIILLTALTMFFSLNSQAQHADSLTYKKGEVYYWGEGSIGGGTYLIQAGAEADVLLKNTFVLAAKANANANIFSSGKYEAEEYAFMVGLKLTRRRYTNFFFLTGIATVDTKQRGPSTNGASGFFANYDSGQKEVYTSVGVPLSLKLVLTPVNFMAFDFAASANLNSNKSFFALTFGIAFGKVRSGPRAPLPQR